ncbi:hypothetical protein ACIBSW_06190 [Actinoplanes sp. NPDC049668]|uniref:Rv0361 family membrane protein n=1 Tax=unclassified Actinoplanes TaxID=2626549 RepID=UPI00339E6974
MTQSPRGEPTRASSIAAADAPDFIDFIDDPTAEMSEWPPVGAYPGEPGYPPDAEPPTVPNEVLEGDVVWHQPPPTGPFHARHEKPGEWRATPPEHLAWEHSPPAEVQPGVQREEPTEAIALSMLPQPWQVPFDPHTTETTMPVLTPAARRRRTGLRVSVALVLTLLIFVGGAVSAALLLREGDSGKGEPDPVTAVNTFLTAVYVQQDAAAAAEVVCREALDQEQLNDRVDQIKGYANEYDAPTFSWTDPAVTRQTDDRATVVVPLTMTTDDEKTAQQQLTFTVIRKTDWLVCDVSG